MADTAPPRALDLAAVESRTVFRGTKHEVGIAVEEDVAAIVAVLPDVLRQLPIRRIFDLLTSFRHRPLGRVWRCAGRPVEFVVEDVVAGRRGRWTRISAGLRDRGSGC